MITQRNHNQNPQREISNQFWILFGEGLSPAKKIQNHISGRGLGRETDGIAVRKRSFRVRVNEVGVCPRDKTLEFDPSSGRTLAACLKHASRTNKLLAQK